jgi:hypothetical protein
MAGRETSPESINPPDAQTVRSRQKELLYCLVQFNPSLDTPSQEFTERVRTHVRHLLKCLIYTYTATLNPEPKKTQVKHLASFLYRYHIQVEKFFKWFYGCGMAYAANKPMDQVVPFPTIKSDIHGEVELGSLTIDTVMCFFTGSLRRFLRSFFRRCHLDLNRGGTKRRKVYSKGQSFLMFKKGSPEMSADAIASTVDKHKSCLGNRGIGFEGLIKKAFMEDQADIAMLKLTAEKIIRETFRKNSAGKILYSGKSPLSMPSFRASFAASRCKGGSAASVKKLVEPLDDGSNLVSMDYHPRLGVVEKRSNPEAEQKMFDSIYEQLKTSNYDVAPVFLQEPLKIRTITKGPPIPYWYLKPIQKFLWRNVSRNAQFGLIKEPISAEYLNDQLLSKVRNNPLGSQFVSGDYSSATDNLSQWLCLHIWNYVCEWTGIECVERRAGAKSLVGHKIHYEDEVVQQWNGQLMGSPLSFPILCLANATVVAAAFWEPYVPYTPICKDKVTAAFWTREVRQQNQKPFKWADLIEHSDMRCRLKNLPFLINGDDCVMWMSDIQYASWMRYAELIGMSPSIGKCYRDEHFLEMNSENYSLVQGKFVRTPFVNLSLASPISNRGGEIRELSSFSSLCRSFIRGYTGKKKQRMITIWIELMLPTLKKVVPDGMNWGLPQWLGGLGLPLQESRIAETISARELKLASYLFQKHRSGVHLKVLPGKTQSLPKYLVNALRECSRLTVTVPVEEEVSQGNHWAKAQYNEDIFGPIIWRHMRSGSNKMFVTKEASVSQAIFLKRFKFLLNKSSRCRETALMSLHELLKYKGVRTEPVGGVASILKRMSDQPTGLYSEISHRHLSEMMTGKS